MKEHSEKWFLKRDKHLKDPFRNTKKYNYIPTVVFIVIFFIAKDYYHGWLSFGLSFLSISVFFHASLTWAWFVELMLWLPLLTVQIVAGYYAIKSFANISLAKYYFNKSLNQASDYLGSLRSVTLVGSPGCGKTFTGGANFAIVIAQMQWQKLKSDYFLQKCMLTRWIRKCDTDKLKAFQAIEAAYLFYSEREGEYIPCLISSIPLEDQYGRRSYELTLEMYLQLKRAPECSVLFNDECGVSQGANTSRTTDTHIADFWRFNRHFGDFILINTEQGGDGTSKAVRKVTDCNIRLAGQTWLMAPNKLIKWHNRAQERFIKRVQKGKYNAIKEQRLGEKLFYRGEYIKTIGFRKIPYRYETSEGNLVNLKAGEYIFPARGFGAYDSRAFRNAYAAKDMPINLKPWQSLLINESDLHRYDPKTKEKKAA